MKVFLDDERETPIGWERCFWPDEVITLLNNEKVTELSLDHDLGDDKRGTGYDVLCWLEAEVALNNSFIPPKKITIHSANLSARQKMLSAISSIDRFMEKRHK